MTCINIFWSSERSSLLLLLPVPILETGLEGDADAGVLRVAAAITGEDGEEKGEEEEEEDDRRDGGVVDVDEAAGEEKNDAEEPRDFGDGVEGVAEEEEEENEDEREE